MDTTATNDTAGVSEQADASSVPEIAAVESNAQSPKNNAQPVRQAAPVETFDEVSIASELFKADLTQNDDYRRAQSAYDRQISELKQQLEAMQRIQSQSSEERTRRALEALQDDPEAMAQYWKSQYDLLVEKGREAKLRAEYEAEQANRQRQTLKGLAEQANEIVKEAGLRWDSPLLQAFSRKFPEPSPEAVRALGRAVIAYQNKRLSAVTRSAPTIARDARIEALRESGAVRTSGSVGGTDNVVAIASQMKKALLSNDLKTYRTLKEKFESLG